MATHLEWSDAIGKRVRSGDWADQAVSTVVTEFRRIAYGHAMPDGHEAEHLAVYERHNREVREHFRGREADFLEVCWETGSGWKELGDFLKLPVPDAPLPHANRSADKRGLLLWKGAQRMLRRVIGGDGER